MKLVLVEWTDSYGCAATWEPIPDELEPSLAICRSVGWLVYQDADAVVVVPHLSETSRNAARHGCGDMTIPAKAINRMVALEERHDLT